MSDAVEPRIFRGLRDYLPDQMRLRNRLIDAVRAVYESYGFLPLGTPGIEYLDVLLGPGGHEANEQIFRVRNPDRPKADSTQGGGDEEAERLGLRFDLTVPLARVISQYPNDLPLPFRRYQVASVWRADKPDRGRYREFTQFDIDSVGVESELADAEIIAAMCDTMTAVEAGPFKVRFSSRKILNLLLAYAGVPAELSLKRGDTVETRPGADVFRVLDKLPKIGIEKVRLELTRGYTDESGDKIPGLGLELAQVQRIENFLNIKSDTRRGTLDQLTSLFAGGGGVEGADKELAVVRTISDTLAAQGYDESKAIIDLSIARGLAYYTGPVFETTLDELPQFGSVMSGGRYDDLVKRFKGTSVPAVGTSIGIDRLLAALVEGKKVKLKAATAQVLVTTMDSALQSDYLKIASELRRAGIRTEIYLGSARVGKQMKYADGLGIPLVILIGSDENTRGVVQIKQMDLGLQLSQSMATREEYRQARPGQFEVPRAKLVDSIKDLLAGLGAV